MIHSINHYNVLSQKQTNRDVSSLLFLNLRNRKLQVPSKESSIYIYVYVFGIYMFACVCVNWAFECVHMPMEAGGQC